MTEGFERTKPVELPNWVRGKDDNTDWQSQAAADAVPMPISGKRASDEAYLVKSRSDSELSGKSSPADISTQAKTTADSSSSPGNSSTDIGSRGKSASDSSLPGNSSTDMAARDKVAPAALLTDRSINETILESLKSKVTPDTSVQIQKPADAIEKFRAECAYTPLESLTEAGLRAGWRGGTTALAVAFLTSKTTGIIGGLPTKTVSLLTGVGVGVQTLLDASNRQAGKEKTCFDAKIDDYFGIKKK